jgi:hypothetical protein
MTQFVFCLIEISSGAEPGKLPNDADLTKLISGNRFQEKHKLPNGDVGKGVTGYRADGKFNGYVVWKRTVDGKVGFLEVKVTGTWKVMDGLLIESVETCDPPTLLKSPSASILRRSRAAFSRFPSAPGRLIGRPPCIAVKPVSLSSKTANTPDPLSPNSTAASSAF